MMRGTANGPLASGITAGRRTGCDSPAHHRQPVRRTVIDAARAQSRPVHAVLLGFQHRHERIGGRQGLSRVGGRHRRCVGPVVALVVSAVQPPLQINRHCGFAVEPGMESESKFWRGFPFFPTALKPRQCPALTLISGPNTVLSIKTTNGSNAVTP